MNKFSMLLVVIMEVSHLGNANDHSEKCDIYKKVIDTIAIRNNTAFVSTNGSDSKSVSIFSEVVDTGFKMKKTFPSAIYVENNKFLYITNIKSRTKVSYVLPGMLESNSKAIVTDINEENESSNCLGTDSNFVFYTLTAKEAKKFNFNKKDAVFLNGKEYKLTRQKMALSQINYSDDKSRAYVYIVFQKENKNEKTNCWYVAFKMGIAKENKNRWEITDVSRFPNP